MSGNSATIYVVDDDASFRGAVTRLLRAGGYNVETFCCAADFLKRPLATGPACAILDLRMPGHGGMELQSVLNETHDFLPIIFLTGHGDIPTSVRAMRRGAVDFLTKPVQKQHLFEAIARALVRAQGQLEEQTRSGKMRDLYERLTPREREVLEHVVAGRLNKETAAELGTSERTVKAHRAAIMEKLKIHSVPELVIFNAELKRLRALSDHR